MLQRCSRDAAVTNSSMENRQSLILLAFFACKTKTTFKVKSIYVRHMHFYLNMLSTNITSYSHHSDFHSPNLSCSPTLIHDLPPNSYSTTIIHHALWRLYSARFLWDASSAIALRALPNFKNSSLMWDRHISGERQDVLLHWIRPAISEMRDHWWCSRGLCQQRSLVVKRRWW